MSEEDPPAKRMRLGGDGLLELSREELLAENKKQETYIAKLLSKLDGSTFSSGAQSDLEERLKQQHAEANRKEKVLLMQLTRKEQELQEMATQLGELTKGNTTGPAQLRSTLLDPALNILLQRMRRQLDDKTKKLQQATDDMAAWKFTADSQTGKRLMSKCRTLIQENQELGKQVSTGRTAQLEAELALQKKYSEELKASQEELNEFVIQLDEEVEGMQSTICALQQQLKDTKDELAGLKARQAEPGLPRVGQSAPVQHAGAEDLRTSPTVEAPAPMVPDAPKSPSPSPAPSTPCSPTGSPPLAEEASRRTPSGEVNFAVASSGEPAKALDHRAWSSEVSPPTPPSAEAAIPAEVEADRTPQSPRDEEDGEGEERERTSPDQEEPLQQLIHRRTPELVPEQVRTFSDEEMETQEQQWKPQQQKQQQQQQHKQQEEEAEEMDYQLTGKDLRDPSSPVKNPEHQEEPQGWWGEEPASSGKQQQEQPQPEPMEEKNPSSPESQGCTVEDLQWSRQTGELTSPVASPEVSKRESDSDRSLGASVSPEPPSAPDQTQANALAPDQSRLDAEPSVEPNAVGDAVSPSVSDQGKEGLSPKVGEGEEGPSTNSQPPPQFQTEGNGGGQTSVGQDGFGPTTLFPEVKVTAKKLPQNCSLSVVDYDTGSSEEDEGAGGAGGAGNGGPRECPSPPPATNHSPASPQPNPASPENSSPTSPATNSDNLEVSPLKSQTSAGAYGDNGTGRPVAAGEPKDLTFIGENGTESVHASDALATASE